MSSNGTYGTRFTGGYQFPSTDHISVARGKPVASEGPVGPWRARVELVPLEGGRPDWWQVEATYVRDNTSCGYSRQIVGHQDAQQHYRRLVDAFRAPGPELDRLIGDA